MLLLNLSILLHLTAGEHTLLTFLLCSDLVSLCALQTVSSPYELPFVPCPR